MLLALKIVILQNKYLFLLQLKYRQMSENSIDYRFKKKKTNKGKL